MSKLVPVNYDVTLIGYSIVIRPISIADIGQEYVSWLNNPEINRYLETSSKNGKTVEDVYEYVNQRRYEGTDVFAILTKKERRLVGTSGLINWKNTYEYKTIKRLGLIGDNIDGNTAPLGYGLMIGDRDAQRMGIGGEAYTYMMALIFEIAAAELIFNMAVVKHLEVIKMAKRVGYKFIHTFENHVELADGKYDGAVLTMTKDEWQTQKERSKILLDRLKIIIN